ncbi:MULTISPECIES: RecQ family ATP-dependent DNA helicase [Flavobacteriaceae]|uniref:ATP-dependent DNA helicase RecQ n=2 Tax=Flavobacteriaceae TaxID=49546 RepID=A0A4Y8AX11_9FLAO|nr:MULTISPECIES: RecQ family ATP-dependent DNA helicase [Flavobacteriaceae]TEW77009.1 RecQ family ATP-dependent DNA helicase [Gramella jeungdoensis]GGK58634.1 ATP-dependent DNA helicase RecQ2 [Lutibacter litoralis]
MNTPLEILKTYWNYNEFRPPQEEIINTVIKRENCVVLLPTGNGKSLCYQVPALVLEGVCIVISPLIALIKDQVESLTEKNIKAIALTSKLSQEEIIVAFDNLQFGGYKFLYLSPEKLQSPFIQDKIRQLNVSFIAIDEAHCISEWGHDFRPAYLKIPILKELQPNATFIALTATATQKTFEDIVENLEIENAAVFKKSLKRTNLTYKVIYTENYYANLLQILNYIKESVIIYTNNRKQTKEVNKYLQQHNFKSTYYHGGLSVDEKNTAYATWISDKTPIMVATNAFGMGIDKPNVRVVIHLNIPNSLENYIQEAGRAGRDGKESHSLILTNEANLYDADVRFKATTPTTKYIKEIYFNLNQFYKISFGEQPMESFNFSIQEFCATYKLNILTAYNAIKVLERENIILLDENFTKKSTLKFTIGNSQLFNYLEEYPSKKDFIKLILRSYGGIFEHHTIIDEFKLSKKLGVSKESIIVTLKDLNTTGIVKYNFENSNSRLSFLVIREDNYTINRISKNIEKQYAIKYDKLTATINFIRNIKTCRNIQLLSYFNEINTTPCGKCDVCTSKNAPTETTKLLLTEITKLLAAQNLSSQELSVALKCNQKQLLNSLKILLEKNKIAITSQNKFKLNL